MSKGICYSKCGLNCGLCLQYQENKCEGCFSNKNFNKECEILQCPHNRTEERCNYCDKYPCEKYAEFDTLDTIFNIRHNRCDNMKLLERIGIEEYLAIQERRINIFKHLMKNYDGKKHSVLFMVACSEANLEEMEELIKIADEKNRTRTIKKRSKYIQKAIENLEKTSKIKWGLYLAR